MMSEAENELKKLLESMVNHKVVLAFLHREEHDLREITGVLKSVHKNTITLVTYTDFGEKEADYHLFRCGCTLVSVSDFGEVKGAES